MTKDSKKYKILSEEDIKIIESDPTSLADYVTYTKVKEARKSAIIITIIAMVIAFGAGMFCGMGWTKTSIPNNVVQIQVGETSEAPVVEEGK